MKAPSVEGTNTNDPAPMAGKRSLPDMKRFLITGLALGALCLLILVAWLLLVLAKLPNVSVLKHYRPPAAAEVLDRNGRVLAQYFDRTFRIWVPIASLPDRVIHAVVTAEDDTFFEHRGVNYKATWNAFVHDIQKGRFARGGSTITQQMIKNVLLTREKTMTRKLREYVLARKAEEVLTKRQILQIYLNEVEWGDNIHGVEAASRFYFDKHAQDLSVGEAALLAGMLPNPRYYNPFKRVNKAKGRQEQVLFNMFQAKLITAEEYEAALRSPLDLRQGASGSYSPVITGPNSRPCYQSALEQVLTRLYGEHNLYRSGLTIKTSLDGSIQDALNREEDAGYRKQAPDQVTVVWQGELVRGILCTAGKDLVMLENLNSAGFPRTDFEMSTVRLDSISRAQLVPQAEEMQVKDQNSMLGEAGTEKSSL
jgi:penicillin-binding protein 1A